MATHQHAYTRSKPTATVETCRCGAFRHTEHAGPAIVEQPATITLTLTRDDLDLLVEALDSHAYWQLSDDQYRNDGAVLPPGSDDDDNARAIAECDRLSEVLTNAK